MVKQAEVTEASSVQIIAAIKSNSNVGIHGSFNTTNRNGHNYYNNHNWLQFPPPAESSDRSPRFAFEGYSVNNIGVGCLAMWDSFFNGVEYGGDESKTIAPIAIFRGIDLVNIKLT